MFTERVSLSAQTSDSAPILRLLSEEEKQSGFPTLRVCVFYTICVPMGVYIPPPPPLLSSHTGSVLASCSESLLKSLVLSWCQLWWGWSRWENNTLTHSPTQNLCVGWLLHGQLESLNEVIRYVFPLFEVCPAYKCEGRSSDRRLLVDGYQKMSLIFQVITWRPQHVKEKSTWTLYSHISQRAIH